VKIAVLLKQTFDTEATISLDSEGQINRQGVNLIINPYDEFALEEALCLKENYGGEVTVISAGAPEAQTALSQALAMGADKAVLVTDDALAKSDEQAYALLLSKHLSDLGFDLILAGWRAIDDGSAQVALRVAERLGIPHINVVTKLEINDGKAVATRETEGGSEIVEVSLPAVITAQKGLNEPRYPSARGIMQAKKKPLQKLSLADIGLSADQVTPKVEIISYFMPPTRSVGKIIPGEMPEAARELCRLLREEAKIL